MSTGLIAAGVLISFAALFANQYRIFRIDKRRRCRANIKMQIFYKLQESPVTEKKIIQDQQIYGKGREKDRVEIKNTLYEMLCDNTITYDSKAKEFSVSLDTNQPESSERDYRKNQNSLEFILQWDHDKFKEARDLIREIKRSSDPWSHKKVKEKIESEKKTERSVITLLNFFQVIYLSIDNKQVNDSMLKRAFSETYLFIHDSLFAWFRGYMKKDPNMCQDLLKLYRLWCETP